MPCERVLRSATFPVQKSECRNDYLAWGGPYLVSDLLEKPERAINNEY